MRTTIELTNRQRAKLLELAGRQGLKGFSQLVQDAVDRYLEEETAKLARVDAALAAVGSLDDEAADALEDFMRRTRSSWR